MWLWWLAQVVPLSLATSTRLCSTIMVVLTYQKYCQPTTYPSHLRHRCCWSAGGPAAPHRPQHGWDGREQGTGGSWDLLHQSSHQRGVQIQVYPLKDYPLSMSILWYPWLQEEGSGARKSSCLGSEWPQCQWRQFCLEWSELHWGQCTGINQSESCVWVLSTNQNKSYVGHHRLPSSCQAKVKVL